MRAPGTGRARPRRSFRRLRTWACGRGGRSRAQACPWRTNRRDRLLLRRAERRKRTGASSRLFLRPLPCRTGHRRERSCVPIRSSEFRGSRTPSVTKVTYECQRDWSGNVVPTPEFVECVSWGRCNSNAAIATRRLLRTGNTPAPPRPRILVRGRARPARGRRGHARADPGLGDPAGVGGRVDLPVGERPYPGGRDGRPWPEAVPLPRRLAAPARPREVRPVAGLRAARCRGSADALPDR